VPVTTRKFRNYRRGDLLTSAAGIAGNLLLVFVFAIIGEAVALVRSHGVAAQAMASLQQMCWMGGVLNVALIVFNLLPVPPLDGSRLIVHFLSPRGVQAYREFERYGFAALWVLLFLGAFGFIGPLAAGANALVVTLVDLPFGLFG
jgi:Zn-dependent protease